MPAGFFAATVAGIRPMLVVLDAALLRGKKAASRNTLETRGRRTVPAVRMENPDDGAADSRDSGFRGQPVKGVAMKRLAILCAALGMLLSSEAVQASSLTYGGYQPWWNIFA